MDRMTAAELAAWRHLLGLTLDELADQIGVNPRTTRSWETGRDPIPPRITDEIATLRARHDNLVSAYLDTDEVIGIVRDKAADTPMPRGWYVAAAARAMQSDPDLMVEWV